MLKDEFEEVGFIKIVADLKSVMMLSYKNGKMEASSYKDDMPTGRKEEFEVVAMKARAENNDKNCQLEE